ncbi:hypothetical protein ACOMHN_048124 [Nucella lapillus]
MRNRVRKRRHGEQWIRNAALTLRDCDLRSVEWIRRNVGFVPHKPASKWSELDHYRARHDIRFLEDHPRSAGVHRPQSQSPVGRSPSTLVRRPDRQLDRSDRQDQNPQAQAAPAVHPNQ